MANAAFEKCLEVLQPVADRSRSNAYKRDARPGPAVPLEECFGDAEKLSSLRGVEKLNCHLRASFKSWRPVKGNGCQVRTASGGLASVRSRMGSAPTKLMRSYSSSADIRLTIFRWFLLVSQN